MTESIRVESIQLGSAPTTSAGQIDTPTRQGPAAGGSDPLDTVQRAAVIGDSVPIVFGRRVGSVGGVLVSPPATEARFSNNASNDVTASYLLVISEGRIDPIQVRDVFQQSCRVGTFTQAYSRRAGTWGPGNFITAQAGFEDSIPDAPIYCGSGTGSYAGMTTGSFTNTIPHPFTQWDRQVHVFSRGGMWVPRLLESDSEGPSNNVADLVRWMLRRSSRVPEAMIDQTALQQAARFTNANGLWFNGTIEEPSNLADWLSSVLPYFLLRESRSGGKRGLRPLLPFNAATGALNTGAVGWSATFDEDSILPGSIEINYTSRGERLPFCCQVLWRQQPEDGLGLARTAEIRYGGSAIDGPFEQHDLSAFCTSEDHAVRVGAYILARRRYVDHRLALSLRPEAFTVALAPGDIVRVRLRRVASVGANSTHDYLYEVERIARAVTGELTLELTHFPVDDQGRSLVALDVSRVQATGIMLPTGRADVTCDLNSAADTSFNTDFGPWDGWEISIPDIEIYGFDTTWPDGVIDTGDGWGPGVDESVPGLDVSGVGGFPDTGWQEPGDADPAAPYGDGWTDGDNEDGTGWDGGGDGDSYTGAISWSQPLVTYPEVWYAITDPAFAQVEVTVSVSPPPRQSGVMLTIVDGVTGPFSPDPTDGLFGSANSYTVVIPEGETSAKLVVNAFGDSPFADTERAFQVTAWQEGDYKKFVDPETQEVTPALDISATAPFTVHAYVGSITLEQPGVWTYDTGNSRWVWAGAEPGDWTWDEPTQLWQWGGSSPDWEWDEANQRWNYIGAGATGWAWVATAQRWVRNVVPSDPTLATQPEGPPDSIPSPAPDSVPPASSTWTVVAQATVDQPPIPNGANDLSILLEDFLEDGAAVVDAVQITTPLTVPAVSMLFGGWRWDPAAEWWEYPNPTTNWRWNPVGQTWEFLIDSGDWSWDQALGQWVWSGEGSPGAPPANPPEQNSSFDPPDAARWIYVSGAWTAPTPASEAQVAGGTPPDFTGLLSGTLTYHMPEPNG